MTETMTKDQVVGGERLYRLATHCLTPVLEGVIPSLVRVYPDAWELDPGTCPTMFSGVANHPDGAWHIPGLENRMDASTALDHILARLFTADSTEVVPR
jgi:hypothetical protein